MKLENPSVSGEGYVGAIAGYINGGSIDDCTVSGGTVSGDDGSVGGIVGDNRDTVKDCDNSGEVSGTGSSIGAVAGSNSGTVSGCKWLTGTADSGIGGGTDEGTEEYS